MRPSAASTEFCSLRKAYRLCHVAGSRMMVASCSQLFPWSGEGEYRGPHIDERTVLQSRGPMRRGGGSFQVRPPGLAVIFEVRIHVPFHFSRISGVREAASLAVGLVPFDLGIVECQRSRVGQHERAVRQHGQTRITVVERRIHQYLRLAPGLSIVRAAR